MIKGLPLNGHPHQPTAHYNQENNLTCHVIHFKDFKPDFEVHEA